MLNLLNQLQAGQSLRIPTSQTLARLLRGSLKRMTILKILKATKDLGRRMRVKVVVPNQTRYISHAKPIMFNSFTILFLFFNNYRKIRLNLKHI